MEARATQRAIPKGVTADQLAEAERGARQMLSKKFSPSWISAHVHDLIGQANVEYAEWLEENPPARNPIGWLLNCVYWRALNRYEAEARRPPTASLEAVFHVQDESAPNPEREALDHDRQDRLRQALGHLPEKEKKLLALVYYEDYSIREAGQKLGWGKSAADRHHKAAMEKMLALVGDRALLSPAILGPAAWVVVHGQGRGALQATLEAVLAPVHKAAAVGSDAVESGAHRLGELGRRLWPFADAGNAAAAGGGGRIAGYCGAAAGAVVCGLVGSGAVGPGVDGLLHNPAKAHRPPAAKAKTVSSSPAEAPRLAAPSPDLPAQEAGSEKRKSSEHSASPQAESRKRPSRFRYPAATGKQSASEFGDNNFGSGASPESTAAPETSSEAPAESAPAPAPSGGPVSGSQSSSEFGL